MTTKNSQLFLISLMVLALVHGTSCRYTNQAITNEETEQGLKTKYSSMFQRALSVILRAEESNKKINPIHTVSRRSVPCGPNPLHN